MSDINTCSHVDFSRIDFKDSVNKIGWFNPICGKPIVGFVEDLVICYNGDPLTPVCKAHAGTQLVYKDPDEYRLLKCKERL